MRKLKLITISLFVLFINFQCFAQINDTIIKKKPIDYPNEKFISTGISYQYLFSYQIDYYSAKEEFGHGLLYLLNGYKYGIEATYYKNFIIAPKVSYEINAMFLCFRAGISPYFSKNSFDLRILPEIGFSLYGKANLCYGYNIPVYKKMNENINE